MAVGDAFEEIYYLRRKSRRRQILTGEDCLFIYSCLMTPSVSLIMQGSTRCSDSHSVMFSQEVWVPFSVLWQAVRTDPTRFSSQKFCKATTAAYEHSHFEKLIVAQLVNENPTFCGTQNSITVFNRTDPRPESWAIFIQSRLILMWPSYLRLRKADIISSRLVVLIWDRTQCSLHVTVSVRHLLRS